ncbi:hypothetical protein [Heyndrickxia oleronia]|uniref:Prepilin type IV endopeptidase peptidase domain-containing protein n=1 Tax=Heyndrickxia oleronia TaxID=38875 RepID=A0AAW6T1D4_9BACI|nr:hypothetical protein [Heyndrickxia oleronia]MDH5163382.1 hypothetical protein [Heyndrickxia oleronia]
MEKSLIVLLIAVTLYYGVNIYTDIRYRKTKNIWHLLFLLSGGVFYFTQGFPIINFIGALVLALLFGLLLEAFKITYAGDTKMCIVSAVWLSSLQGTIYITVLGLYVFYLLIILLISYFVIIRRKGWNWTIKNQLFNIKSLIFKTSLVSERIFERFPGAVAIGIGTYLQVLYLMW